MQIYYVYDSISDRQRSDILFKGDLIVFRQLPALIEMNRKLALLIKTHMSEKQPFKAEAQFNQEIVRLQQQFQASTEIRHQFRLALKQAGVDLERNYADHLFLRCVPPKQHRNQRFRGHIGYHRDTWGSNIQHQINWWSPVHPVTEQNTIAFYPDYWKKPIANTSDRWSYEAFCKARKVADKDKSGSEQINYPYAPEILETVDDRSQTAVVIEPGDLLCFSSAHLHASIPNSSAMARYSTELRSFNLEDLEYQRMPENVDNAGTEPHYEWFRRLSDDAQLNNQL